MKKLVVMLSFFALLMLSAFGAGRLTGAQEASPAAADEFGAEGVTFEVLGAGAVAELPPAPSDFTLFRLTLDPGGNFPIDPTDPGLALVYVESGALTVSVDVPLSIEHVAGVDFIAGETPEPPREIAAGESVVVEAGDSFVGPPFSGGELRNDGTVPVAILISSLNPNTGSE